MSANYKHMQNAVCEYFPCHKGLDAQDFNCLFCYCPLYFLKDCGGSPAWRGLVKDCTGCALPHAPGGWEAVQARLGKAYAELRAGCAPRTLGPEPEQEGEREQEPEQEGEREQEPEQAGEREQEREKGE